MGAGAGTKGVITFGGGGGGGSSDFFFNFCSPLQQ